MKGRNTAQAEFCTSRALHAKTTIVSFQTKMKPSVCNRGLRLLFFYLVLSFILLLFIYIFFIYYYRGLHLLLSTKLKKPHHCTIAGLLQ